MNSYLTLRALPFWGFGAFSKNSSTQYFRYSFGKKAVELSAIQKIFINLQVLSMFRSFFLTKTITKTSAWMARLYTCYEDS